MNYGISVFALMLGGCVMVDASDAAQMRASNELNCPASHVVARPRPDLSPITYDVRACGQTVRYTCQWQRFTGMACVPELPLPSESQVALGSPSQ